MLRGFVLFLLSILALFGAKDLAASRAEPAIARRLSLLAPLLAVPATIAFVAILVSANAEHPEPFLAAAHFIFLWGSLTIAGLALVRGRKASFLPLLLLSVALIDGVMASHFSEGTIFSKGARSLLPLPSTASIDNGAEGFGRALGAGMNLNLYFKVPAFRSYAPFANHYQEAIGKDPLLREMALGDDRIWFAPETPEVPLTQASFDAFARRVAALQRPVIFRHSRAAMLQGSQFSAAPSEAIRTIGAAINLPTTIVQYSPDKVIIDTSAPSDGWLMLTDRWSRSWQATVNGTAREVSCADFIYRAVPVVKGSNRIEFSFHPFAMPGLLIASWTVAGFVGLLSLASLRRGRAIHQGERESFSPAALIAGAQS